MRSLYPPEVRIAIVLDNLAPHLSIKNDTRVGEFAEANNIELAPVTGTLPDAALAVEVRTLHWSLVMEIGERCRSHH